MVYSATSGALSWHPLREKAAATIPRAITRAIHFGLIEQYLWVHVPLTTAYPFFGGGGKRKPSVVRVGR